MHFDTETCRLDFIVKGVLPDSMTDDNLCCTGTLNFQFNSSISMVVIGFYSKQFMRSGNGPVGINDLLFNSEETEMNHYARIHPMTYANLEKINYN